jgi:hypothetical protein
MDDEQINTALNKDPAQRGELTFVLINDALKGKQKSPIRFPRAHRVCATDGRSKDGEQNN